MYKPLVDRAWRYHQLYVANPEFPVVDGIRSPEQPHHRRQPTLAKPLTDHECVYIVGMYTLQHGAQIGGRERRWRRLRLQRERRYYRQSEPKG